MKKNVGSLPIYQEQEQQEVKQESSQPKVITKTIILPDGSYGTKTIVLDDASKSQLNQDECSYL